MSLSLSPSVSVIVSVFVFVTHVSLSLFFLLRGEVGRTNPSWKLWPGERMSNVTCKKQETTMGKAVIVGAERDAPNRRGCLKVSWYWWPLSEESMDYTPLAKATIPWHHDDDDDHRHPRCYHSAGIGISSSSSSNRSRNCSEQLKRRLGID